MNDCVARRHDEVSVQRRACQSATVGHFHFRVAPELTDVRPAASRRFWLSLSRLWIVDLLIEIAALSHSVETVETALTQSHLLIHYRSLLISSVEIAGHRADRRFGVIGGSAT